MYGGNGNFVSKSLSVVDPVGSAIDKQIAKSNPNLAAGWGPYGTPGRAQARSQLDRKKAEDRQAFEQNLRALYPNAFIPTGAVSQIGQSPLGNAFIETAPKVRTIL